MIKSNKQWRHFASRRPVTTSSPIWTSRTYLLENQKSHQFYLDRLESMSFREPPESGQFEKLPIPETFPTWPFRTHIHAIASTASHISYHDDVSLSAGGIDTTATQAPWGTLSGESIRICITGFQSSETYKNRMCGEAGSQL